MSAAPLGRGLVASAPEKVEKYGAAHPTEAAAASPMAYALRAFWARIFDQGRSSGCVPHAFIAAVYAFLAAVGTPLAWVPSPWALYGATRCREQPGDGPLADSGVAIVDCVDALATDGLEPMRLPAADGRFSDVATADDVGPALANVGLRPTLEDDIRGFAVRLAGCQRLSAAAPDFGAQVASSIANRKCGIVCGIHATPAVEAWFRASNPSLPALNDASGITPGDGHGVVILDYRTEADGLLAFWILSSWGAGGDEGGIWMTEATLRALLLEAWRVEVTVQPSGGAS